MSADCVETGVPEIILTKDYDNKPKEEDLYEVFAVIYREQKEGYKVGENEDVETKYVFFTNVGKAVARFKLFGPKRSILKRILTDKKEIWELGEKNSNIQVEVPESESESESESETQEEKDKKEFDDTMAQLAKEIAIQEGGEVSEVSKTITL